MFGRLSRILTFIYVIFAKSGLPDNLYTKSQVNPEMSPMEQKVTTVVTSYYIKVKKTELTAKFETQLAVVEILIPHPLKCKGYISEFITHGVPATPIEKNVKYINIAANET